MDKTKFNELYEQILKLKDLDECALFFDDLCTLKELESMVARVKAAKMLLENKTFIEVIEKTNISSATLSRVSKCVRYGEGGYKTILERKSKK
ncbi:MAG: YerC/YecD family TrpR-related protein [Bacilli bacterium]|nr:YerC/YecD family TrpR-related protein [Bacilli bacterium]